jgi:putative transposase
MENYRKSSHTVYDIKYHIVWITKYRKPIMKGLIGTRLRDLLREICRTNDVEIIKGHVSPDHIHMFLSVPPSISVSNLVQKLKGKTSYKLMQEFKALSKEFWGRHMWARGYFVASSGNITDEVIIKYIEEQGKVREDDDFKVEDE